MRSFPSLPHLPNSHYPETGTIATNFFFISIGVKNLWTQTWIHTQCICFLPFYTNEILHLSVKHHRNLSIISTQSPYCFCFFLKQGHSTIHRPWQIYYPTLTLNWVYSFMYSSPMIQLRNCTSLPFLCKSH